jgi:mRNA-degrading endonuclease toxin of MazEF toxin-antitoxin module
MRREMASVSGALVVSFLVFGAFAPSALSARGCSCSHHLRARSTGLPKDSVANVSQIVAIDRGLIEPAAGRISSRQLHLILRGIDIVLGR